MPPPTFATDGFAIFSDKSESRLGVMSATLASFLEKTASPAIVYKKFLTKLLKRDTNIKDIVKQNWRLFHLAPPSPTLTSKQLKESTPWLLLIPKKLLGSYDKNNPVDWVFKHGLHINKYSEEDASNLDLDKPLPFKKKLYKDIEKNRFEFLLTKILPELFVQRNEYSKKFPGSIQHTLSKTPRYVFFITAHGATGSIAGMHNEQFGHLLDFLDRSIMTVLIVISSCYSSGENINIATAKMQQNISYQSSASIVTDSTTDTPSTGPAYSSRKKPKYEMKFDNFFNITQITEPTWFINAQNIKELLKLIILQKPNNPLENYSSWRKAGNEYFEFLSDSAQHIEIGPYFAEGNKSIDINTYFAGRIDSSKAAAPIKSINPKVISVKTAFIKRPLIINHNDFKLFSSKSGEAIHIFEKITAQKMTLQEFEQALFIEDLAANKLFIFKDLEMSNFKGALFYFNIGKVNETNNALGLAISFKQNGTYETNILKDSANKDSYTLDEIKNLHQFKKLLQTTIDKEIDAFSTKFKFSTKSEKPALLKKLFDVNAKTPENLYLWKNMKSSKIRTSITKIINIIAPENLSGYADCIEKCLEKLDQNSRFDVLQHAVKTNNFDQYKDFVETYIKTLHADQMFKLITQIINNVGTDIQEPFVFVFITNSIIKPCLKKLKKSDLLIFFKHIIDKQNPKDLNNRTQYLRKKWNVVY